MKLSYVLVMAGALGVPTLAVAEPPISVFLGAGARLPFTGPDLAPGYDKDPQGSDGTKLVASFGGTLAVRLPHQLGVGIHLEGTRRSHQSFGNYGMTDADHDDTRQYFYDLAVAVQYEPARVLDRQLMLSAWVGPRIVRSTTDTTLCTFSSSGRIYGCNPERTTKDNTTRVVAGLAASYDLVGFGPHHLAAFVEGQVDSGDGSALELGLAYRY